VLAPLDSDKNHTSTSPSAPQLEPHYTPDSNSQEAINVAPFAMRVGISGLPSYVRSIVQCKRPVNSSDMAFENLSGLPELFEQLLPSRPGRRGRFPYCYLNEAAGAADAARA
jgi:hypothetical protein